MTSLVPRAAEMLLSASGPVVVISPHLDDAVLSLGASITELTRGGAEVRVVTVLAGDPDHSAEAGEFDRRCGFKTAGEAVLARQAEDARACAIVGAEPLWLPYWDGYYSAGGASVQAILRALSGALREAGAVLLPGFPLLHPDHRWVTRLMLANLELPAAAYLYVEQPYAMSRFFGSTMRIESPIRGITRGLTARTRNELSIEVPSDIATLISGNCTWEQISNSISARMLKNRAIGAYGSQLSELGHLVRTRLAIYESCWGGEAVAPLPSRPVAR